MDAADVVLACGESFTIEWGVGLVDDLEPVVEHVSRPVWIDTPAIPVEQRNPEWA